MTSNGTGSSNPGQDAQAVEAPQTQRQQTIAVLEAALARLSDVQAMLRPLTDRVTQIEARRGLRAPARPLGS